MNAGMLNKKIAIQKLDITQDDMGSPIEDWQPYCSLWAYVNSLSGSEYWSASAVQAENTVVFTVRYSNMLKEMIPQMFKIVFDGVDYDIKHIDNVQFANNTVKIKAVARIG